MPFKIFSILKTKDIFSSLKFAISIALLHSKYVFDKFTNFSYFLVFLIQINRDIKYLDKYFLQIFHLKNTFLQLIFPNSNIF